MLAVENRVGRGQAEVIPALRTSQLDIALPYGAGSIDLSQEYISAAPAPQGARSAITGPEAGAGSTLTPELGRTPDSSLLDTQLLSNHRFSGFEMLAGPEQRNGFTERISFRPKDGLTLGSALEELTTPTALGTKTEGPTLKTQGNRAGEAEPAIDFADLSISFAA